ncbi:hypothetical protein V5H29_16700 [Vibrio cholerae]|uniref:hypothetical protein n=1 Tax=Vibrio cholerae TaxID=666 RepID=UPI0004D68D25|nr:hypothetical protein [Vibrio cholerae]EGQ8673262.1 hypothetical protein [Vibrio cholerae]EGR1330616.1 hypothetical protein [Vibrio cholerae]EGR2398224.1 hypothetical protein [Vibrio cholerae]EGR2401959.1 hypothetical protein [Vibrio cholerae]EGR4181177.1 hypothetical protein [Vibrio cholerae]
MLGFDQILSQMVDPLRLYDFAPFLSVAIAINFVSSFWDGVKNKAINNLNSSREAFITELNAVYTSGNCQQSDSLQRLNDKADKYKSRLSALSFLATLFGLFVVFVLFILLALIGFAPEATLTIKQATQLCITSIVPSTAFRLAGVLYSKYAVNQLEELSSIMKGAAKAAIKDNQRAAYKF